MKRELVLTCGSVLLVVGAACAGAEDDLAVSDPDPPVSLDGAASPDDADDADADVLGPDGCSAAGWCATQLPDGDLTLKDIWPLPGHAFAIAESPSRGVKVLEWTDAASKWAYIDDNSQNQSSIDLYAGKVWAASADEVYFTVAPRTIYHGRRKTQPDAGWAWTHQQLEDRVPQYPASAGDHYRGRPTFGATNRPHTALGVFGTASDDVYAWYANTIYRATKDRSGNETWEVEYVADDIDDQNEQLFFLGATASSKNDVWFAGGRGGPAGANGCPVLVHKTPAGYRRVADGTPSVGSTSNIDGGLSFDGGIIVPGDGGIIVPGDGGIVFPPPGDGGIVLPPPSDGGIVLPPPSDGGIVFPPPSDGGIVLPPPSDGGIGFPPPSDGGIVFPPPSDGGIVLPPPGDGGFGFPLGGEIGSPSPGDGAMALLDGVGFDLDGGIVPTDGGFPIIDGGFTILDSGVPLFDAGVTDGGVPVTAATMCKARAGSILLGAGVGWIGSVSAVAPQEVVLLKGGREVVTVAASGDDYDAVVATLPNRPSYRDFVSLWSAPNESVWLGGQNIILRGSQGLSDGGIYEISTISLTGAWLETPIYQIRGSSSVDRWAVGARYALHKTTP